MSPEEIIAASRPYIEQGMIGFKIKIGSGDMETDAERCQKVRDAFGDDVWFAVDANQRYSPNQALDFGRFLQEEVVVDWFEEPLSCEDVEGHARLAARLDVPIALGETLFGPDEFAAYLRHGAVDVVQPDVTRVGGITEMLRLITLAETAHRPVAPHLLPEISVHLACGLPQVTLVEWMPWLTPAFVEPPVIVQGKIVPPPRPGLGLEIRTDYLEKYRIAE
jgi:L-alanine-DL-glutamate epimerase-like enolase superfamily enzyme